MFLGEGGLILDCLGKAHCTVTTVFFSRELKNAERLLLWTRHFGGKQILSEIRCEYSAAVAAIQIFESSSFKWLLTHAVRYVIGSFKKKNNTVLYIMSVM